MTSHVTVLKCAATLVCALCFAPAVPASASQLEMKWNELGSMIIGHQVKLVFRAEQRFREKRLRFGKIRCC